MESNNGQISINELLELNYTFEIPNYQRGYRWEKTEVIDLIEDINCIGENVDYKHLKSHCSANLYCLQPIALDNNGQDNKKVVVDGQQRLTTIFLLIEYISNEINSFTETDKKYVNIDEIEHLNHNLVLEYEDKKRNEIFNKVKNNLETINDEDIDAFYITKAYEYISEWFSKKVDKEVLVRDFAIKLLYGTSVILYDIIPEYDGGPHEYFAKTNTGRIPLTNSELIKAILMLEEYCVQSLNEERDYMSEVEDAHYKAARAEIKKERLDNTRIRISRQWDSVENQLRKDEFWYFLSNNSDKYEDTRIDYIFEIVAKSVYENVEEELGGYDQKVFFEMNSERASFIIIAHFLNLLNSIAEAKEKPAGSYIWNDVWETYSRLEEWFDNYEWYHIVGYLLNSSSSFCVDDILDYYANHKYHDKNEIKRELINCIEKQVGIIDIDNSHKRSYLEYKEYVSKLKYDDNKQKNTISNVILLFNVLSILGDYKQGKKEKQYRTRDTFFPFARYKQELWNLEHIHSIKDDSFDKNSAIEFIEYLEKIQGFLYKGEHKDEYEFIEELLIYYKERVEQLVQDNGEMEDIAIKQVAEELYAKWIQKYEQEFNENYMMGIGNLTLLDDSTNKSYKNSPFFVKRMIIKEIIMGKKTDVSKFIPLCTRNVFDKTYTDSPHSMMSWNNNDYEQYLSAIVETIYNYLEGDNANE